MTRLRRAGRALLCFNIDNPFWRLDLSTLAMEALVVVCAQGRLNRGARVFGERQARNRQ